MYPQVRSVNVDDKIPGSLNFKWGEALWLPKWGVYCLPTPEQAQEIISIARIMDAIKVRCGGKPLSIESWLRPANYNQWSAPYGVAGAKFSAHQLGAAVDFKVYTVACDEVRKVLLPELDRLKIRMENLPNSPWVHIDRREPGGSGRFFTP